MTVEYNNSIHCEGFEKVGTIVIQYKIYSGIQKIYHKEPGRPHDGGTFTAYLPRSMEGNKILKRLQEAFRRGLTLTVGTSRVTGQRCQILWSSISHKTSLSGGPSSFGYPDPLYLRKCQHELDTLGIPA
jgi:deltex-like protein